IRAVGENREARGPRTLVRARQHHRIEIGANQAARRRSLLDLGDQAGASARRRSAQRRRKPARPRRGARRLLERRLQGDHLAAFDLDALVGADTGEDVTQAFASGAWLFVIAIIRASAALALPPSMEAAARATPSPTFCAAPAINSAAPALSNTIS